LQRGNAINSNRRRITTNNKRDKKEVFKGPLTPQERLSKGLTLMVKFIIQNMLNDVDIKPIVERVTQIHSKDAFGDFKDIFMSLLEDSSYECLILANVSILLEEDAYRESCILEKQRRLPYPSENIKLKEIKPSTPEVTTPLQASTGSANTRPRPGAPAGAPAGVAAVANNALPSFQNDAIVIDRLDLMQPEEVKVPVLQICRKLKESVGTEVALDKRIKVGQDLVQSLIPSMANYQSAHVQKAVLYETQTAIQLVKRKYNEQKDVITAKRGELSQADTIAFFPQSQVPLSS